jgi:Ser/Thr protein kinase RdoA (MazF antagonist)
VTPELKARSVLASYGLKNASLTRLGGADNTNFRVDADESFALRLRKPGRSDRVAVASELAWLGRLQADTLLVVPEPVVNGSGELITGITFAGEAETLATLTRWVQGAIPPTADALSPEQLASTGAVMAHLHRHARQFSPPEWFERPRYGKAYFRRRARELFSALSGADLDREELSHLEARAEHVVTRFAGLERTPERFGLIHADFHSGNYVLFGAEVRVIDFDRCGFGFYLFDLALALMELGEAQWTPFLQGYKAVAPLPPGYPSLLQGFLCLAYLDNLGFLAANPEELPFIVNELPFVSEALRKAADVLP